MSEQKACPFCKMDKLYTADEWKTDSYDKQHFVECGNCGARGPLADTLDEAWRLWNTRSSGGSGNT